MGKLLLNSLLIVSILTPFWTSDDPSAARGLRRAVTIVAAYVVVYTFLLVFVYGHLS